MPTKRLPETAHFDHLRAQAKDLLRAHRRGDRAAFQRVREFLPRLQGAADAQIAETTLHLADAQLAIAREYGFASWPRLKMRFTGRDLADLNLPHHERIEDTVFRRAVDMMDEGDVEGLRELLGETPALTNQRISLEGGNYFTKPSLLEFIAENPVRHGTLPANAVEIAKVLLVAGADAASIESTLGLVASGRVVREAGAQEALIDLLAPLVRTDEAMAAALGHGEFGAAEALLRNGAALNLSSAAALGRLEAVEQMLETATTAERHLALAWAAQFGRAGIVSILLKVGVDPNQYNPPGGHMHSTPLHQAALAGHREVVEVLLAAGADASMTDIHHGATPAGWARHAGHSEIVKLLGG